MKLIHCPQRLGPSSWSYVELILNHYFEAAGILYKTLCPPSQHLAEMEPCDVLYTQAEFALEALQVSQASVTAMQRDSTHIAINDRMYREENKRLGIDWQAKTPEQVQRGIAEYGLVDRIVVTSNVVRDGFIAEGVPAEKMKVITTGVDLDRYRPGARTDDGVYRVRCAAILGSRKGIVYLLEAWRKLGLKNAELVFTGWERIIKGSWVLEKFFKKWQDASVIVSPFLNGPEHDQFYHKCDLHVLPSLEEGLAGVTLEAMASGLPQVVTRETGVTDIWTEECGRIVPVRDVDALAEAIKFYYDNRDIGRIHGQTARRLVEKYTWARFGEAVAEFVKGLV